MARNDDQEVFSGSGQQLTFTDRLVQVRAAQKAEEALIRRRIRRQAKSMATAQEIAADEARTNAWIAQARLKLQAAQRDARMDALLALRRSGRSPAQAVAAVESGEADRQPIKMR